MKHHCLLIVSFIIFDPVVQAQSDRRSKKEVLDKFGFSEHSIFTNEDSIEFFIHKKPGSQPINLVLYLQGTSPDPLFVTEEQNGKSVSYRWFPGDYQLLDETYCYAVIAKSGIPALRDEAAENIEKYHQLNYLQNRVFRADTVINYIASKIMKNPNKIIVYGHSEGAPVAARLGTINSRITHIGFWAGNALPDFYDFILMNSRAAWSGEITTEKAYENNMNLIAGFKEIANNSDDVSAQGSGDYTNKRWWSYAEPPINDLLKINVPLFVQVAGNDESAPVESTYLIPLEFARLGKKNLTFQVCLKCDHGFEVENQSGKRIDKWEEIFQTFIKWASEKEH